MPSKAFFAVHRDLPREGPGLPDDVLWALDVAQTPDDASILDAACGPGADTVTLAEARPNALIDAVDITPHFVEATQVRTKCFEDRITARVGDYTEINGTYDLIWCAGAAYFVGFTTALSKWRTQLTESGAIAFSEPVLLDTPPPQEVADFWAGESDIHDRATLKSQLDDAGWRVLGERLVMGDAWKAYYDPQAARIEMLKDQSSDTDLARVIVQTEREIALWQRNPDQIAYILFVVRPK